MNCQWLLHALTLDLHNNPTSQPFFVILQMAALTLRTHTQHDWGLGSGFLPQNVAFLLPNRLPQLVHQAFLQSQTVIFHIEGYSSIHIQRFPLSLKDQFIGPQMQANLALLIPRVLSIRVPFFALDLDVFKMFIVIYLQFRFLMG